MAVEPKRSFGPTGTTLKPIFTPSSLSYQFRQNQYDPAWEYWNLGNYDLHWQRRLLRVKPPYHDTLLPELQVVRNRPVPYPKNEKPRDDEPWGYMTPKEANGVYVTVQRTQLPPAPGLVEILAAGLRRLFGA